jgi:hypothetical protein
MMVSLFPHDQTDTTGIPADKNVTLRAYALQWAKFGNVKAPSRPPKATAPDADAANALAASVLALGAVAATLY